MIYVGVSEAGAYAVIDGNKSETRTYNGDNLIGFLRTLKAQNTRCVIEMANPGVEHAAFPMSASEAAYRYCRTHHLPFMVVKKDAWRREMFVAGDTKRIGKSSYESTQFETRTTGSSPEEDAMYLAEYGKQSL